MAKKIISRSAVDFLFHQRHFQSTLSNFLTPMWLHSRNYVKKKEYNYDLDSLIEWNKDTSLAFGNPVKLTKKGKFRKSHKSPNNEVIENLEALSAMSETFPVNNCEGGVLYDDIPRNGNKQNASSESSVSKYSQRDNSQYEDDLLLQPTRSIGKSSKKMSKSKGAILKEMTEDGIYIPEIKPVPEHTSNRIMKKMNTSSCLQDIPNKKTYSEVSNLKETSSDISKSPSSSMKTSLPVEPPESFNLITEFPLTLDTVNTNTSQFSSKLHSYRTDIEQLSLKTLPSVKTILNKTMPELNRFFLNRWREGMVRQLGEEGFKIHQEATIKRGINFHANVMEFLSGKPVSEIQVMPDNEGHWSSLQSAIKLISDVVALEEDVKHPFLSYRGVYDCLATYKDLLCVVDWKTSNKPRPLLKNTYDDPLQIAAYVGAINASNDKGKVSKEINHGVIVVAYPDGSPAHIHMMNKTQCESYWHDWTERLYNYYQLIYSSKFG